jgi:hypothetical protein
MPYLLDTNHCIYLMNGWNTEAKHGWQRIDSESTGLARHDGGGIADMFMRPVIIVYGTQERKKVYQQAATLFSDWRPNKRIGIGSKTGRFHVKADTELTDATRTFVHIEKVM